MFDHHILVGLDLADRDYFKQARETRNFVFSDYLLAKSTNTPIMMAAYPVSAINRGSGRRRRLRHQSRLDVADHEQSRRPARHFGRAGR